MFRVDGRQTAPYSHEFEPDIILTQPHASGVDETLHTLLVIADGGSIPLHSMADNFCTWWPHNAALGGRIDCIQHHVTRGAFTRSNNFNLEQNDDLLSTVSLAKIE
jgi:hypothetical protein